MRKLIWISTAFMFIAMVQPAFAANSGDKEVLAAMEGLKAAMLKKDRAALDKIFHPELTYGHSSAKIENKAEAIAHMVDGLGWEAIEPRRHHCPPAGQHGHRQRQGGLPRAQEGQAHDDRQAAHSDGVGQRTAWLAIDRATGGAPSRRRAGRGRAGRARGRNRGTARNRSTVESGGRGKNAVTGQRVCR